METDFINDYDVNLNFKQLIEFDVHELGHYKYYILYNLIDFIRIAYV